MATHARIFTSSLPAPETEPSVATMALRQSDQNPDQPAVIDAATAESLSRRGLAARSAAFASGLEKRGIARGDLVALMMPNALWWPVLALGVWRAGGVVVPLSPLWTAGEVGRLLAAVPPRLLVTTGRLLPTARDGLRRAGVTSELVVHGEGEGATPLEQLLTDDTADVFAAPRLAADDLAVVLFSSGLGGLPKGVRLTHGVLSAASAQARTGLLLDSTSVGLAGAGLFHAMGMCSSLCAPLSAGAPIVTVPTPKTDLIVEAIRSYGATHATVPPQVVAQLAADPAPPIAGTTSLRLVVTGGETVPADLQRRASERLGTLVRQAYGMTEAPTISASREWSSPPETVGRLAGGTEARLVDPESGLDAPPGQAGELWIRGPQVMAGYYDDPAATAATITADGWLRTGDLVQIRDDERLEIKDRLKELIKVKGASVAPAELELVLREHPAVLDAAVNRRQENGGAEVPVADVVLAARVTGEEIASWANARVASYKRLGEVRVVDRLHDDPARRPG